MESQLNGFLQLSIVKDSETDPVSYGKADRFVHNLTIKLSWLKYENLFNSGRAIQVIYSILFSQQIVPYVVINYIPAIMEFF